MYPLSHAFVFVQHINLHLDAASSGAMRLAFRSSSDEELETVSLQPIRAKRRLKRLVHLLANRKETICGSLVAHRRGTPVGLDRLGSCLRRRKPKR